jgi:hypothetical protein
VESGLRLVSVAVTVPAACVVNVKVFDPFTFRSPSKVSVVVVGVVVVELGVVVEPLSPQAHTVKAIATTNNWR